VTPYLASRTGVGVYIGELVRALLASPGRDRYKLCAFSANPEAGDRLRRSFPGAEIRVLPVPMRFLAPLSDRFSWLSADVLCGKTDLFHAGQLFVPAARRAAVVVTVHDLTPIHFPEYHLRSNLFSISSIRRRISRADLVIADSSNTAKDLLDAGLVSNQKVRVIPLGVQECFRPSADENSLASIPPGLDGDFILTVGALEPRKNLPRLFQAFRILKDRHHIPHRLAVVGPEGWKDEEVFRSVKELGLSDSTVFTGYVSNEILNLLYNRASLMIYPSLYEGFGLPPLEAMAAGCPVAVSNTSSLPEVVGHAGAYFDPRSVEEMAVAIYQVLSSPERRANLVRLGTAQSREFSWRKTAEATLGVYREAISLRA
jgi:glycosyltransferase involved in cell wall biosynthesis